MLKGIWIAAIEEGVEDWRWQRVGQSNIPLSGRLY